MNFLNNKKIILISVCSFTIIICSFLILINPFLNNFEGRQTQAEQIDNYIIGIYEEKIAVFAQGDSIPIETYDVYVTTLPESDQRSLRKGINVKGKVELRRLIEDYTS